MPQGPSGNASMLVSNNATRNFDVLPRTAAVIEQKVFADIFLVLQAIKA